MAISPDVIKKRIDLSVQEIELKLDSSLKTASIQGDSINLALPNGFQYSLHFNQLRDRYIKVGWKDVLYHGDQRDGDYLTFKF